MDFKDIERNTIVHSTSKNTQRGKPYVHKTLSLDKTLSGIAENYFGIPLHKIAQMTPEELAQLTDRANAMKDFLEMLPVIEQNCKILIQGQVTFEEFQTSIQNEAVAAAKKIDNMILNNYLASQGYKAHLEIMGTKAKNGVLLIDDNKTLTIDMDNLSYQSALQLVALKRTAQQETINAKLPAAKERQLVAGQERETKKARMNLIRYGTKAKSEKEDTRSIWEKAGDWFKGR